MASLMNLKAAFLPCLQHRHPEGGGQTRLSNAKSLHKPSGHLSAT